MKAIHNSREVSLFAVYVVTYPKVLRMKAIHNGYIISVLNANAQQCARKCLRETLDLKLLDIHFLFE